jgi:hypothetical protein
MALGTAVVATTSADTAIATRTGDWNIRVPPRVAGMVAPRWGEW